MVITVYISGISGNKEVKKRQQRVQMILESRNIEYEAIDIAEPDRQQERDRLKTCGAKKPPLPPQLFNGDDYCGDYDEFDLANETDDLDRFLKNPQPTRIISNGDENGSERVSPEKEGILEPVQNEIVEETPEIENPTPDESEEVVEEPSESKDDDEEDE